MIQNDKNKSITNKRTDVDLANKFNAFFRNEHHSFTVLKAEKLASAIYMVTGFISEKDPLRKRLRSCALDIVSCVTTPKGRETVGDQTEFKARCLEIGTILKTAENANLISPMNSSILCQEYADLGVFVEENHHYVFPGTDHLTLSVTAPTERAVESPKISIGQKNIKDKKVIPKKTPNYKRHQNRRDIILGLFNQKDKISIKDAASAIEGCSEKTIQRELTTMVAEGVLLKEGERRWSVYRRAR